MSRSNRIPFIDPIGQDLAAIVRPRQATKIAGHLLAICDHALDPNTHPLAPLEQPQRYQQLIDEYDYTQSDLGTVIGKSRSHVANTLRLLKLPPAVQKFVTSGELSAGHARALVTSSDPEKLARRIVKEGLSVRQAEELGQEKPDAAPKPGTRAPETKSMDFKTADTKALEKQIEDALGMKIDIRHKDNGKGEVRIKYSNLDQLEAICAKLGK